MMMIISSVIILYILVSFFHQFGRNDLGRACNFASHSENKLFSVFRRTVLLVVVKA
jgi:hypothetical protein